MKAVEFTWVEGGRQNTRQPLAVASSAIPALVLGGFEDFDDFGDIQKLREVGIDSGTGFYVAIDRGIGATAVIGAASRGRGTPAGPHR